MLHSMLPLVLLLLFFSNSSLARPQRTQKAAGITVPLVRANQGRQSPEQKAAWARRQADIVVARYGTPTNPSESTLVARGSGTNELINHNQDSSYFGSLAIGTPAQAYSVILDTGSADLWIASSSCSVGCNGIGKFNETSSTSYKNLSTPFDITYGSGRAQGSLAQDTVQMAGFSVSNQNFGVVDTVSPGLLTSPVSGLLGLGFKTISSSHSTPFWQTLVESGSWDQPVMSFYLSRFINVTHARPQEPGGRFTMGFTDQSLYSGQIEYIDIPNGQEGYWILPLTNLKVNGQSVSLPGTAQSSYAAIDTGTTLIGGPPEVIKAIFADIPGSAPGSGDYEGYYTYPCDSKIQLSITFGSGSAWSVDPTDFMLTQLSSKQCVGALFSLESSGNSGPSWIMGDTFLKNVYSVFRYNPPSVGFAAVSNAAAQLTQEGGNLPTPTMGAHPIVATGAASDRRDPARYIVWATLTTTLSMFWAIS